MDKSVAHKLDAIVEEFGELQPRERLELLLEFSEGLPELPSQYRPLRDAGMNRIQECQTPVYLWVEIGDGRVQIHGDVAPESPTVKGFVGILVEAFSGAAPEEILSTPSDLVQRLGLTEALGMVRMRGLHAILHHVRERVRRVASQEGLPAVGGVKENETRLAQ